MPEEVNLSPGGDAGSNVDSDQQTQQLWLGTTMTRALLRAREENLVPEEPGSARRRRMVVSTSRSPLPSDYPRVPLQDITDYMHNVGLTDIHLQTHRRSRPRIRRSRPRMQEGPLQVAQATATLMKMR